MEYKNPYFYNRDSSIDPQYKYIDYYEDNRDYCGMTLTSTILPNKIKCKVIY